ncbi:hypothetical protein ACFUNF_19245 [Streptomyces sp. NPDC057291]|uniref:hypothetical protein n=1 Tax=Streptomyces sp. NPDC057291 TaxID=3346087 RepID=UPI003629FFDC
MPRNRTVVALEKEDLLELTAAAGPLAAAAALAHAPDAGADGYALVLQRLVGADPAAWTADVPGVLAALARPELGAFYLAAAATAARHPDAFPTGPAEAVLAAFTLSRALPAPASQHLPDAAEFAGRAWAGLLSFVWRTGGDLGDDLPAVLDHLRGLAEPLTHPAAPSPPAGSPDTPAPSVAGPVGDRAGGEEELPTGLLDTHPAVRALGCLLEYAAGQATEDGRMPGDVLRLVADVLAAHLLTRPTPAYDADVRRHARALLQAAAALPETERPAQTEQLRRSLVEAGEVDLARTPTTAG